jgi:indole-3-acetate monooxygenase
MTGNGSTNFAPLLPRHAYGEMYRNGSDVVMAGSGMPAGTAEPIDGGWRVTGPWPFARGCQHADWILVRCVMAKTERMPVADICHKAGIS